jgi:hypothetical protein
MHDLECESKTILILYLTIVSSMGDDRRWMYDGWKRNGAHIDEWWEKPMILSSMNSLWRLLKISGVYA